MAKRLMLIMTMMCFAATLGFAKSKGTSGAQFLKIVTAPRAAALGTAYTAFNDDVNSIAFNPAGLSFLPKKEVALVQNSWIQDISNQYLAAGLPMGTKGTLGLGVTMLSVKDMVQIPTSGVATGTKFEASDMAVTLAYAKAFGEKLGVGLSVKSITQKIENESAAGFAADIGVQYRASRKVDLGLAVQNVGTSLKFITEADPLPMTIRAGSAYRPLASIAIGLDVIAPNDSDVYAGIGAEYCLKAGQKLVFPIRAGYRSGYETEQMSGLGGGLGIVYDNVFSIDYAWNPMGILGDSMRFGLSFKF